MKNKIYADFNPISFGVVLKTLRDNHKYKVNEIIEGIGIVRSAYYCLENGSTSPALQTILDIANFYNLSLEDLIRMTEAHYNGDDFTKINTSNSIEDTGESVEDMIFTKCINQGLGKAKSAQISIEVSNYLDYSISKCEKVKTPKVHNYLTGSNLF